MARSWCFWPTGMGCGRAEVNDLRWEQIDFKTANLHVRRVKNGTPATHPLTGREMRELTPPSTGKFAVALRLHVGARSATLRPLFRMAERAAIEAKASPPHRRQHRQAAGVGAAVAASLTRSATHFRFSSNSGHIPAPHEPTQSAIKRHRAMAADFRFTE